MAVATAHRSSEKVLAFRFLTGGNLFFFSDDIKHCDLNVLPKVSEYVCVCVTVIHKNTHSCHTVFFFFIFHGIFFCFFPFFLWTTAIWYWHRYRLHGIMCLFWLHFSAVRFEWAWKYTNDDGTVESEQGAITHTAYLPHCIKCYVNTPQIYLFVFRTLLRYSIEYTNAHSTCYRNFIISISGFCCGLVPYVDVCMCTFQPFNIIDSIN